MGLNFFCSGSPSASINYTIKSNGLDGSSSVESFVICSFRKNSSLLSVFGENFCALRTKCACWLARAAVFNTCLDSDTVLASLFVAFRWVLVTNLREKMKYFVKKIFWKERFEQNNSSHYFDCSEDSYTNMLLYFLQNIKEMPHVLYAKLNSNDDHLVVGQIETSLAHQYFPSILLGIYYLNRQIIWGHPKQKRLKWKTNKKLDFEQRKVGVEIVCCIGIH